MTTTYSADDVRAVQTYMAYKNAANEGELKGLALDIQATAARGRTITRDAVLRYSASRAEATAAPKDSPIITRTYRGKRWYYWLLDRATFAAIKGKERKEGKGK